LNLIHARQCTWLVCTQNQHHPDQGFSDATEPHGCGFLLGKISEIRKAPKEDKHDRWMIAIDSFARIAYPDLWDHGRNPVRYTSLEALGISLDGVEFQPMPPSSDLPTTKLSLPESTGATEATGARLTIPEAKKALAATFGVRPEDIEITIRG
jgi:hypothetical protein